MDPTREQPTDAYTWRVHPARERLGQAIGAVAIIVLMCLAAREAMGPGPLGPGMAIGGGFLLLIALNRYFLPSRFTIDASGIIAKYPLRTRRKRWSELKRFDHDKFGGLLSTRVTRSRLDAYTGLPLLFGDDDGEAIRRIRSYVGGGHVA